MTTFDYSFKELWLQRPDYELWQSILIGLFFVICDLVLCGVIWATQYSVIKEQGYPKSTNRRKKSENSDSIKEHSWFDRLPLRKLYLSAPEKPLTVHIAFVTNIINCVIVVIFLISYIAAILTNGAGWAMCLMMFPPITYFTLANALKFLVLDFIPHGSNK